MKTKLNIIILIFAFLIINIFNPIVSSSLFINNGIIKQNNQYINLTAEEAWNLLNDSSNGIQIPIDVRTNNEWRTEHINTPKPENPRHHNFYDWSDQNILTQFLNKYNGNEIIVYCRSGSRSVSAINILIDNGFNGIIYNLLGGINDWKNNGLPTKPNLAPMPPNIYGEINGRSGENYEYIFNSYDFEDDEIYYYINWSDNTSEEWIGPYSSSSDLTLVHNWTEQGTYLIKAKAKDIYGDESNWSTYEINMPLKNNYCYLKSFNNIIDRLYLIMFFIKFYNTLLIHF